MLQIWGETAPNQAEGDREGKESIPLICSPLSTIICSAARGSLPVHLPAEGSTGTARAPWDLHAGCTQHPVLPSARRDSDS